MRADYKISNKIYVSEFDDETKITFRQKLDKGLIVIYIYLICTFIFITISFLGGLEKFGYKFQYFLIAVFSMGTIALIGFSIGIVHNLIKKTRFNFILLVLKKLGINFLIEQIIFERTSRQFALKNFFTEDNFLRKHTIIEFNQLSRIYFSEGILKFNYKDNTGSNKSIISNCIDFDNISKLLLIIIEKLNENPQSLLFQIEPSYLNNPTYIVIIKSQ